MFTCKEFGCDTKAMKHSAIRLALSLWAYVHCVVGTQNRHGVNGLVGGVRWMVCVTGGGEKGWGRGERKEPSHMWNITKFHSVSGEC
jgi:hypothetical protein